MQQQAKPGENVDEGHTQKVVFKEEAHQNLLRGAETLANAVSSTMGPSGHSVILDNEFGAPSITKDGVTVAKSINLKDRLESIGAELLKEIASKTNDLAGDGTSTATILGHALLQEGIKQIATGRNSVAMKKGMEQAVKTIVSFLEENCIAINNEEDIINIGTISSNGDREIGELIAAAINKVGKDGIITVEPAKSIQTNLDVIEGMQINNGYVSPFFVTNSEKNNCELENPYILMTSNKLSSLADMMNVLEKVARAERPLLVIADEIEGDVLHTLIVNKMKGALKVCAVKAPSYGEHRADILDDLSKVVGGEVFGTTSDVALKKADIQHLGQAKKVIINRTSCTVVGDATDEERKNAVQERIQFLRNALQEDKTLDELRVSKYRERLAKLSGGIAVIKVGGSTELEIQEKKDRVEDAVNATLAATQEGIVPGGGVALFYAARALENMIKTGTFSTVAKNNEDIVEGIKIVSKICEYPLKIIVKNTANSPEVVANTLYEKYRTNPDFRIGYNATTGTYANLIEHGIIDPRKVTRLALEHAVSIVGLMLTCNAVIVNDD